MKHKHLFLIAILTAIAFACLFTQHARGRATQEPPTNSPSADDDYERQMKDYEASVKRQAELQRRGELLLEKEEAFVAQQEKLAHKYEAVLATWERQQQEYQRYLDTLPKK